MKKDNNVEKREGFIDEKEIANFLNVERWGTFGTALSKMLMRITKIHYLNEMYIHKKHLTGTEFIDAIFDTLNVQFEIHEKDLKRIPKKGPFITVSNHPLGGIDGLILLRLMLEKRPEFKVLANFLLERIEPLQSQILPVNPFEDHQDAKKSFAGIKSAIRHLREGAPLGIFPAGEVSTKQKDGIIKDRPWLPGAVRLIQMAKVPVVPVYFHAFNSNRFYRLSSLNGMLRTAMLPREMTKLANQKIIVRIGNPINHKSLSDFETSEALTAYLREKTYFLQNRLSDWDHQEQHSTKQLDIEPPKDRKHIAKELDACREKGNALFTYKNFEVFSAYKPEIPNILHDIGREREIAFRAVGEGTNLSIDLDKFDDYYRHLFIYNMDDYSIVGAYRCGLGKSIYEKHGIQGFYLNELFKFEAPIHEMLSNCIELGRAFVCLSYQKQPASLFLLWKGILHIALHEKVNYIVGGVSISNHFSDLSKSILIDFIQSFHWDAEKAKFVKARNPFKVDLTSKQRDFIHQDVQNNIQRLDRLIDDLELQPGLNVPILLKKYLKQNAKLFGFNIDPKFNNAVDGLMYVNVRDLPNETVISILDKFQDSIEESKNKGT